MLDTHDIPSTVSHKTMIFLIKIYEYMIAIKICPIFLR